MESDCIYILCADYSMGYHFSPYPEMYSKDWRRLEGGPQWVGVDQRKIMNNKRYLVAI